MLKLTTLGLVARGTMQNAEMASALGVSTSRIYMITFGLGAAVSGLAGGLLAPVTGRFADHWRDLHRQGLYHRDLGRDGDPRGHRLGVASCWGA